MQMAELQMHDRSMMTENSLKNLSFNSRFRFRFSFAFYLSLSWQHLTRCHKNDLVALFFFLCCSVVAAAAAAVQSH